MKETTIESMRRVTRPGHYILKIESFTLLSEFLLNNPNAERFESPSFEAGGHKWKLSLYPRGNKKMGGDDQHISLYLVTADDGIDNAGTEINAMYKLFVMDQLSDVFLTFQDNEVRRFHGGKREWGFSKLISLENFKKNENGYLVNDCCIFGVEVFVIPFEVKLRCFSMVKDPPGRIFTWKFDNFLSRKDESYLSESFKVGGYEWKLQAYPRGTIAYDHKYLSLFLVLCGNSCQSKIYVDYNLIVKNQLLDNNMQLKGKCLFQHGEVRGFYRFMNLSDLKDESNGYLVKDSVVFEVKFNLISQVSDA